MAWEKRGNRRYYYYKTRIGDRVVSQYVGNGPSAHCIAQLDQTTREMLHLERLIEQEELEVDRTLDRELDRVIEMITKVKTAVLLTSGYHTHRGQWRKMRIKNGS